MKKRPGSLCTGLLMLSGNGMHCCFFFDIDIIKEANISTHDSCSTTQRLYTLRHKVDTSIVPIISPEPLLYKLFHNEHYCYYVWPISIKIVLLAYCTFLVLLTSYLTMKCSWHIEVYQLLVWVLCLITFTFQRSTQYEIDNKLSRSKYCWYLLRLTTCQCCYHIAYLFHGLALMVHLTLCPVCSNTSARENFPAANSDAVSVATTFISYEMCIAEEEKTPPPGIVPQEQLPPGCHLLWSAWSSWIDFALR